MRTEYRLTVWLTESDAKKTATNGGIIVPVLPGTTEVVIRREASMAEEAAEMAEIIRGTK